MTIFNKILENELQQWWYVLGKQNYLIHTTKLEMILLQLAFLCILYSSCFGIYHILP